jgi:anti-anti-sigma factor
MSLRIDRSVYYLAAIVTYDRQQGVLRAWGDEDRTTGGRRRRSLSAALGAGRDVVVDLSALAFADTSFMVDLAVLAQRLRCQGRHLRLCGPQPHVHRLIELMGLHRQPAVSLDVV